MAKKTQAKKTVSKSPMSKKLKLASVVPIEARDSKKQKKLTNDIP